MAKFPSPSDDRNVMAWEKTALDLASAAGIDVPENSLVAVAGRSVLVVDRFDRLPDGRRRGYQSAMTALELADGDQGSYPELAAVIEMRSRSVRADLEELFRRIVFTILISNVDDHLRNHAFVHVHAGTWALSPAFDVNPDPQPGERYLSTAIDTDTRADLGDLLASAVLYRLSDADADALAIARQVRSAVGQWRETAARNGLTARDCDAMASAFESPAAARAKVLLGEEGH